VFSSRIPLTLTPNRLSRELARLRAEGRSIIDLTLSNPTSAGFDYPADLLTPLGDPRALTYAPQPLGLAAARRAVADEYARDGLEVRPERIVLTASTSEAYALIFKILANAGDEVLVPRPSYPLFDYLTLLDLVTPRPYDLEYHGRWSIDFESVDAVWTSQTRAVLVVSPNNPTGSFITADDLDRLAVRCAERGAAIVADEVFADYPIERDHASHAGRPLDRRDALTFSLGGLSKSVGLPQVKLGWIALAGPDSLVVSALERLELVCDTYLSVSTPVQVAAPSLLARGATVREQIRARVAANYRYLVADAKAWPSCEVLGAEGGWYGVLRVPSLQPEEDLVLSLLNDDNVLTHPGYFFDFPHEAFIVVSLLTPEDAFAESVGRVLRRASGGAGARAR
jgi:aspartate/methionine/tyrosine aminotransferase